MINQKPASDLLWITAVLTGLIIALARLFKTYKMGTQ
jgi:hypothetical protein